MTTTPTEVRVTRDWVVPFFPMRPASGPRLTRVVAEVILDRLQDHKHVYQPKLNGDRALLAIVNGKVIVCNRHYGLYQFQVVNAGAFLAKLGNGTLLDGEVYRSNFYPFDCLAVEGRSFKSNTTDQREVEALQICRLCGVKWMFPRPTRKFLLEHPEPYEGVVRKRASLPYILLPNASATSSGWLKMRW